MPDPVITVNGVSVSSLNVSQGVVDPARPVFNRAADFAANDGDLSVVFLQGSSTVFVSATVTAGDPGQISWQLDRDPSDGDPARPQLSATQGPRVSFPPNTAGNFRLAAYVDLNHTGKFHVNGILFAARFAIVKVVIQGAENFRTGLRFLRTGLPDAPVAGMTLDAVYLLEGGGAQATLGARAVTLGNAGNLISDTFRVDYPPGSDPRPGTGIENPGGVPPLLDTSKTPGSSGGTAPFRARSNAITIGGSPRGTAVRLTSHDNPGFSWADPHPVTGNPAGPMSGGNSFREFVIAFSSFFPNIYVPFYQADWTATACGAVVAALAPAVSSSSQPNLNGGTFFSSMVYSPSGTGTCSSGVCRGGPSSQPSQENADFGLGQVLGAALGHGSDIVYGELHTDSPPSGRRVELQVKRAIRGDFTEGELIQIPYAPPRTSPKTGDSLARAWDHVQFSHRKPAMAVLTRRPFGDLRAGDPVLMTSRQREFQIILSLMREATLIDTTPTRVRETLAALASNPDHALAGYLYAHVWHHESHRGPQFWLELLMPMIGNPSVPPAAWREMAEDIVLSYALLSNVDQATVVARFVDLALRTDIDAGFAGFRGLGKIAGFSSISAAPADAVVGLTNAYRRLVKMERMPREAALESALVIALD